MIASFAGHEAIVRLLISAGANADMTDVNHEYNALMIASVQGNVAVAKLLLEAGADVNAQNGTNVTPTSLTYAIAKQHEVVVKLPVDHRVDVNLRSTSDADSPLAMAITIGNEAIIRLLLGRR